MDEPKFKVGDRVLIADMVLGTVSDIRPRYVVDYTSGGVPLRNWYDEEDLGPAPEPLPRDHIDRHWIPGAVICKADTLLLGWYMVCPGGERVATNAHRFLKRSFFDNDETGWGFHPDSPVKTPREDV